MLRARHRAAAAGTQRLVARSTAARRPEYAAASCSISGGLQPGPRAQALPQPRVASPGPLHHLLFIGSLTGYHPPPSRRPKRTRPPDLTPRPGARGGRPRRKNRRRRTISATRARFHLASTSATTCRSERPASGFFRPPRTKKDGARGRMAMPGDHPRTAPAPPDRRAPPTSSCTHVAARVTPRSASTSRATDPPTVLRRGQLSSRRRTPGLRRVPVARHRPEICVRDGSPPRREGWARRRPPRLTCRRFSCARRGAPLWREGTRRPDEAAPTRTGGPRSR
jgi:hypothetical protein